MKDLRAALARQDLSRPGPVEPIALFRGLKIRAASAIKEMWAPQADALRAWHAQRAAGDILFQLNTGAGKTLIGLVAAQSLVNETRGQVVYCCATRQLVEQTRGKADDLGISTATYFHGDWSDRDVYQSAKGPVLTTYAALFNGRSIFRNDAVTAVVFDDAHTAHDAVRGAFTLSIDRQERSALYEEVVGLIAPYFDRAGRRHLYDAVVDRREPSTVLMVPLFESVRHAEELYAMCLKHGAEEHVDLKFGWAHLGDRLDRCLVHFDANRVQITPLLPPVGDLRVFRDDVRRLYLSATMRVNDEFIRTFGKLPKDSIAPGGRAGDTERLFLVPPSEFNDGEARDWAEAETRGLKALIMTPSWPKAREWEQVAELFGTELGDARVRQFAKSDDERLVFVARYDGIDLPDDACRVMVVDGLPSGLSLLDRFFEQHLERVGISDSKIASRFVQILGRTSRGMSDYGAVLLIGRRLLDWVLLPRHRMLLPEHVQRQLDVGERLSALVAKQEFSARELIDKCLEQHDDWVASYQSHMDGVAPSASPAPDARTAAEALAWVERRAADALWREDAGDALRVLMASKDAAFAEDVRLGGWFLHWAGFAAQLAGDHAHATALYREAARVKRDLGVVPESTAFAAATVQDASPQARQMVTLLQAQGYARVERELTRAATNLDDAELEAGPHEEAIRVIGEYLGYQASRPEKTTGGKGPDAMWVESATRLLLFDAKTKKVNAQYNKDLIGRSVQHGLWATDVHPNAERLHFIVGPRVPATKQSTPPAGLRIVAAAELARVARDAIAVYQRAYTRNLPLFHGAEIDLGLADLGLGWSVLPTSMESVRLDSL